MEKRKKAEIAGIILFVCVLSIFACDDIFEKDLSGKRVVLVAPGDSLNTDISTQTFYWKEVEGALTYNLQVVTPSFGHIEQLVVDTNVTSYKFTLNLTPGKYQWRVVAKNGSSETDSFFIRSLQIDSTLDLSKQKVELSSPVEGLATNSKKVIFQWKRSYNATGYVLQVGIPDLNGSLQVDTTVTSISVTLSTNWADGTYTWGVKAFNDNSNTDFSTRTVLLDKTIPAKPSLTEPKDKAEINTSTKVRLLWDRATGDGGSTLSDSVFISTDSVALANFRPTGINKFKVDTLGLLSPFTDDASYFWRVRTVDAAGNRSEASEMRKFVIKKLY